MRRIIGGLDYLPYLRNCITKRESSWDRTGGNRDHITVEPGDTATLAKVKGPGAIRHIWVTIACQDKYYLRKILLRAYWDGENKPSIDSPIGDFFGIGHGVAKHFISLPLTMTCDRGFNTYFPMPFNDSAEIEVVNECDVPIKAFYYHIDYELYDKLDDNVAYFHAKWRRELVKPSKTRVNLDGKDNYLILYAEGRGHYVGCVMSVHGLRPGWWGEGDDMIFVDGEKWPPSLHGTGTEDYFNAAWGFNREFYGPYHGFPLKGPENWTGYHSMYRFHIQDPVVFRKSIRVTIEHGHANDRGDDISSVAYWYQVEPHVEFAPMPPAEKRIPLPPPKPADILEDVMAEIREAEITPQEGFKYLYWLVELAGPFSLRRTGQKLIEYVAKEKGSEEAKKILLSLYEEALKALGG